MPQEGQIVEFVDGATVKLAHITRISGRKFQAVDENGKQLKLTDKQILVEHNTAESATFRSVAGEMKKAIGALCSELDVELLWQDVCDSAKAYEARSLAELYFGSATPEEVSAVFRKLLSDELRFRSKNNQFIPRSAEEVEHERAAEARRRERAEQERITRKWLKQIKSTDHILEVPPELERFVQLVSDFLMKGHSNEASEFLEALNYDQSAEELAFDILVKTGKVNPGSDAILQAAGLSREFLPATQEHAQSLTEFTAWEGRDDFTDLLSFSIDDDDTMEIDDAITFEDLGDRLRIGVHIADLSCFVKPKDPVDEEALRRCATIYLPTGPVHMIPEAVSCELASLNPGETRPSFSTVIDMSRDGKVLDWRICRGVVTIRQRLNYEEADELIDSGEGEVADALRTLDDVLHVLMRQRLNNGAMIFSKKELKVRVNDDDIAMRAFGTVTPSRDIIAELMIQTNRFAAEFARRNDIPIIYRAQVPPDDPARRYTGQIVEDTNPNVFRGLKKSRLSLHPQPHAGLGLKAYTQVTSPLRRFGDLVMQRQIAAFLSGNDYPYTSSGLLEVIGNAEFVERENRALERRCVRYWELEYFRRDGIDKPHDGIVMCKIPGAYLVALVPYPVRGRMPAKGMLRFGERIKVRICAINPPLSIIRLEQVYD